MNKKIFYVPIIVRNYKDGIVENTLEHAECTEESFNHAELANYSDLDKLVSLTASVDANPRQLRIMAQYSSKPTEQELNETAEFICGQCSDGWGEGFEQEEQHIAGQSVWISTWSSGFTKNFYRTGYTQPETFDETTDENLQWAAKYEAALIAANGADWAKRYRVEYVGQHKYSVGPLPTFESGSTREATFSLNELKSRIAALNLRTVNQNE